MTKIPHVLSGPQRSHGRLQVRQKIQCFQHQQFMDQFRKHQNGSGRTHFRHGNHRQSQDFGRRNQRYSAGDCRGRRDEMFREMQRHQCSASQIFTGQKDFGFAFDHVQFVFYVQGITLHVQ